MLDKLDEALKLLPNLLNDKANWDSLIINRRKPHTYRVFTILPNGLRLCLHKFDPCCMDEAFLHPHPWPGAFILLEGSYRMKVGYSKSRTELPADVLEVILTKGCKYEIINPLTWHSVTPLEPVYTIMVNGEPWDENTAHVDVRTTKGKDLNKMPEGELEIFLGKFKWFVSFL